jgi:NAD(P)-dependent dehydrogenase (short-subunit alcohol dehydrogenase family)
VSERMRNKRVLVTGAGTGIGRGVALEFGREGADVALHYSHSDAGAKSAADEIRAMGRNAEVFQADFTTTHEVARLADEALAFLGGLDILINNAGITTNAPFGEITMEQWDVLYHVNVRAAMLLTQKCVPALVESKPSSIVNLTSVHAYHGMTEHSIYAGTKGAIVAYTRELAIELAQQGIRLNAIAPGWIAVENHFAVFGEDLDLEAAAYNIPAGFVGEPRDVARLAMFLSSDDARYIVGQTIVIDGGQMSVMPNTGDFRRAREWTFGKGYVPGV